MLETVPEYIDFPKEEEKILGLWKSIDAFKNCLKQSKGKPRYTFYDGPPFATGLPHYGHILAGTIKDIVTRFAHQSGFHVERRFGWDCHGLPVEYEIDKTLGIKGPSDVQKIGIDAYNKECRKIVMRYAKQWEEVVGRMGRWIDFENDYKTLYPSFMESVWFTFKQLFNKGLVYKGVKVMPFSTACSTPLSNFESGQNYKEVVDPAVIVAFPLDDTPDVSMIIWTTTPWTLPSNLAICVNPRLEYVKVKDNATNKMYIMMEARLEALFKKDTEYTILEKFQGSSLEGKGYEPIFPYFKHLKGKGAFRVLCDTYVTEESGTGVVHQAPYFGEDDYRICLANGVITKDQDMICPVDFSGKFVDPVKEFKGQYVKDADKDIIKYLKSTGRLVHQGSTKHSYPFCWRSETPLIYRAVPSWFIRVEHMTDSLLKANHETYWVPDFVKEKRFANWLSGARDWAVSRNRYWGTPMPLWISDDGEEVVCVGSIAELEKLTNSKITDIHREFVDQLTIPSSRPGKGPLRRISEVFDCWFESGSMPYAQAHYPFEDPKSFTDNFPADFIAEGVDQTRGWFYTLLVISTALFGKAPFKNLIVNGLVLASDGQKMSKSKKNYPDPMDVVNKFGADSLRLYLINSPVVRAETLRFKEDGVRDVLKDVFLPWYNSYRFLVQNIHMYEKNWNVKFTYSESVHDTEDSSQKNIMDCWILSFTQSLVAFVSKEMKAYRLYTVVPRLVKFVDHLTNWYVRMNRRRLKGDGGEADCKTALETLFSVLYTMVRMMPFTPSTSLPNCKAGIKNRVEEEATYCFPTKDSKLINEEVERKVSRMQEVVDVGRLIRERNTLPIKYPLSELVVIHEDSQYLEDVKSLQKFIIEELNIKNLTVTTEKQNYGVKLRAEPDTKALGIKLRSESHKVAKAVKELSPSQLHEFVSSGSLSVLGHTLVEGDIRLMHSFEGEKAQELSHKYQVHSVGEVLVLLDITRNQEMLDEGTAREVINRIQKLRKKAHLVPSDPISVFVGVSPATDHLSNVVRDQKELIEGTLKASLSPLPAPSDAKEIIRETTDVKGAQLEIVICHLSGGSENSLDAKVRKIESNSPGDDRKKMKTAHKYSEPFCRYVNVELCEDGKSGEATCCSVLLENPKGRFHLTSDALARQVQVVFGIHGKKPSLYLCSNKTKPLTSDMSCQEISDLHSKTLYAFLA
ncbi:hypothetical protein JTE90_019449 [Oedothorax gibbosus]|uniref:Isoleucine--tRNA ligase, cytoplasmic n=1 Tax=Oedothorax gibbosus TaxID=931172 RepID=A0AAV6UV41_9ARAC|nr:hypothetical protein JTE90_019449 [Oedothorax gibbosus]